MSFPGFNQRSPVRHVALGVGAALLAACLWPAFGLASPRVSGNAAVATFPGQAAASPEPLDARQRAEQGDPSAQLRLGDAYAVGDGVEADFAEAAKWYTRAADQGETAAQVKLAEMYRVGRGLEMDRVAALRWLTIASTLSPREREADIRRDREAVAREVTPEDATRAEAQAREWLERFARERRPGQTVPAAFAAKGIVLPRVIREVRPNYTADALRRKKRGRVWVEAVVLPDGSVGDVRVTRSLDRKYGLDEEAVKAARQWRFVPGTKDGVPVPVLITIELTFELGGPDPTR